jgi:hypothetical protein
LKFLHRFQKNIQIIKLFEYPLGFQVYRETDTHDAANIIIIIIIIGSTALGGSWSPQANVASDLYPGQTPVDFSANNRFSQF